MSAPIQPGRRGEGAGLSDRDVAVLRQLAVLRLLTGRQLQRLTVSDGSSATRARRARSMLQRLTERRLIQRLDRRVGGIRAGSEGFVYRLTGRGYGVLARCDGTPPRRVQGEPGERFVGHVLAVSELHVQLVEATRVDNALRLARFDAEPACWRSYRAAHSGRATLRPDAFVHTVSGGRGYVHFIEVDLATESLSTVRVKCDRYVDYWRSGAEQRALGTFPRVLWVAETSKRRQQIERVIQQLAPDLRQLFAVTTTNDATNILLGETNQEKPKGGET
jgi:hypothetical protein